jgi:Domain of Unknown Function with PDB structure (DUF3857)/Transglutaminase-like superfamily
MRLFFKYLISSLFFFVANAFALEQDFRYENFSIHYELHSNATYIAHYIKRIKILNQRGLDANKQAYVSHSASVEKSNIVEAYTLKPDGKKINVPKDNFQLQINTGVKGKPAFSDRASTTVIFPELAIGDIVYLAYDIDLQEAIFPGMFSVTHNFYRQQEYDNVSIRIDSPSSLWAQFGEQEMQPTINESNGRRNIEWKFSNPKAVDSDRKDYSVFDPEMFPGMSFTTFRNYEEIALAYGSRARPKSVPTERTTKLAEELTKNSKNDREKTRVLYEWVAKNISYAGNCIGIGAVVPRDQDFVLDNKMGDCKDHATLLQSLLAAQKIKSTQVLVNAGSLFKLPKYPVGSHVNHVFTYVPSLNLYLDSTSSYTPFGSLPQGVQAKPVLHVDGFAVGTVTPFNKPGTNSQDMDLKIVIDKEGTAKGLMTVKLKGDSAIDTRQGFRDWSLDAQKKYVKESIKSMKLTGDGSITFEDPTAFLDTFSYSIEFTINKWLTLGGGQLPVFPIFSTPAPVNRYLYSSDDADDLNFDVFCTNGISTENYAFTFPTNVKIISLPKNINIKDPLLDYSAVNKLNGNRLEIKRSIDDKSPGGVCTPAINKAFHAVAEKAMQASKAQILYK